MVDAFVITLREGVEAALIIGITLAYLSKINRPDLRKVVYAALGAAVATSVAGAVIIARTGINQDIFEGWIMLAAAFFVVSMVIFMMRTARALKGKIEQRVGTLADQSSRLGLFAFVFLMVLREGVETVLILSAVSLNTTELLNFIGTALGVGVAVVFGVMFVKGSVRIDLRKFFKVTSVILFFVGVQLLIAGLHELSENGVLPSSKREMAIIGPIVRNDLFFFITVLALAGLMILFEYRRRVPVEVAISRAEQRKAQWTVRRERLWMASVYVCSFVFILFVTAQFIYAKSTTVLSPATPVQFANGQTMVDASKLGVGELARYVGDVNGMPVRFFVYRRPDNKLAVLFDACDICGAVGFYTSRSGLICKNCAAPVNQMSVGQPGGCNPVPLKATVLEDRVIVWQADLASGARYFQQP
jgi:high-affinity iron transporter